MVHKTNCGTEWNTKQTVTQNILYSRKWMDEVEVGHLVDHEGPISKTTDQDVWRFVEGTRRQLWRDRVLRPLCSLEHMPATVHSLTVISQKEYASSCSSDGDKSVRILQFSWGQTVILWNSKEEYKPWKWGATARYYASYTKTMLPTRKSVPRSSRQFDYTVTSWRS